MTTARVEAVMAALVAQVTAALVGVTIWEESEAAVAADDCPLIIIYQGDLNANEADDSGSSGDTGFALEVDIILHVSGTASRGAMNDLYKEVVNAIVSDPGGRTLGELGGVSHILEAGLGAAEFLKDARDADMRVAELQMVVSFLTAPNDRAVAG